MNVMNKHFHRPFHSFIHSFQGGSKTQNGRFLSKKALQLKKVCYKVSLCEYSQRHSCNWLSLIHWPIYVQNYLWGGGILLYVKMWPKLTHRLQKRRFRINIRSYSASAAEL